MQYPEIFITGKPDYENTKKGRNQALSDGLAGWGCCYAGAKLPEKFGEGLVEIVKFLGIKNGLAETFKEYYDQQ